MPLVIDLLPARAEQQHAVVIDAAVPVGIEDTGEQRRTAFPCALRQGFQQGFPQILGTTGNRRLGPQNQIRLSPQGLAFTQVTVDDPLPGIGTPAHLLRDVALDHGHPQRLADGPGPFLLLQGSTADKQYQQNNCSHDAPTMPEQAQQQQGGQDRQRADTVYTNQRRKTRQRRIGLGVTETEPGKAGQDPALGPFHREPAQGQQGKDHPLGPATTQPLHQGQQASDEGGQGEDHQRGECAGHGRRRIAKVVQAVVEPVDAKAVPAETERPAEQEGALAAPGLPPQLDQQRRQQQRQRPELEGREGQRHQATGRKGNQQGRGTGHPAGCFHPSLCSCATASARLSITWNR